MKDKTESLTPETSDNSQPFFARFLESQEAVKDARQTLKYPSDRDEWEDLSYISGNNGQQ